MVKGVDMTVKSHFWKEYEEKKKELEKEDKAVRIITNALQADESRYTKQIDEALYIIQKSIANRIIEHENMENINMY